LSPLTAETGGRACVVGGGGWGDNPPSLQRPGLGIGLNIGLGLGLGHPVVCPLGLNRLGLFGFHGDVSRLALACGGCHFYIFIVELFLRGLYRSARSAKMRAEDCPGAQNERERVVKCWSLFSHLSLCLSLRGLGGGHFKIFIRAKNRIHVFWTIFTSAAGFLLASCDKKVTHVTQRFFGRQREDTPVVYIRDNTRVHPSSNAYSYVQEEMLGSTRNFVENYL
jgi:hypothetical protein